jgi:hypothetical protein
LDEETILAALAGPIAERDQARERADFAEGTAIDIAKQDRERKDDLEMEVRRIRMAMEHIVITWPLCLVRGGPSLRPLEKTPRGVPDLAYSPPRHLFECRICISIVAPLGGHV